MFMTERAREPIFEMLALMWSKTILNKKKDNLENRFLKPEYPFNDSHSQKLRGNSIKILGLA